MRRRPFWAVRRYLFKIVQRIPISIIEGFLCLSVQLFEFFYIVGLVMFICQNYFVDNNAYG